MEWPCYTEKDVSASFEIDPKIKESKFEELNGKMTGRVLFNDKKTFLDAQEFNRGLAQGSGKLTIRHDRRNLNEDFFYSGSFFNGCFEGRVRGYNFLPMFDDNDQPVPSNETVLTYIAAHVRGQPLGPVWRPVFSHDGITTGFFYAENSNKFDEIKNPKNFG
jgi:hypothetical protein